jgi:hypothetical protein
MHDLNKSTYSHSIELAYLFEMRLLCFPGQKSSVAHHLDIKPARTPQMCRQKKRIVLPMVSARDTGITGGVATQAVVSAIAVAFVFLRSNLLNTTTFSFDSSPLVWDVALFGFSFLCEMSRRTTSRALFHGHPWTTSLLGKPSPDNCRFCSSVLI